MTLYLKNGTVLECEEAVFEGDFVRVRVKAGELKVPVSGLADRSFDEMKLEKAGGKAEEAVSVMEEKRVETVLEGVALEVKAAGKSEAVVEEVAVKGLDAITKRAWPESAPFSSYPVFGRVPEPDFPLRAEVPRIQSGSFKLVLAGDVRREIEVVYRIPVKGGSGREALTNDLVFFCPYPTQNIKLERRTESVVTDVLQCGIFSFKFVVEGHARFSKDWQSIVKKIKGFVGLIHG
jgi:hypothetical protein